jgi:hypothetical protein
VPRQPQGTASLQSTREDASARHAIDHGKILAIVHEAELAADEQTQDRVEIHDAIQLKQDRIDKGREQTTACLHGCGS